MVKYRLTRYTETFEQFFGQSSDIKKRINEQRTEVAAILTKISMFLRKIEHDPEDERSKVDFGSLFQQAKTEIGRWNFFLELYLKDPDHIIQIQAPVGFS